MFHLNTTTVLLLHEDRVKEVQKVHKPFLPFRRWKFWRKSKGEQDHVGNTESLAPALAESFNR
jgi:hypothetical protein